MSVLEQMRRREIQNTTAKLRPAGFQTDSIVSGALALCARVRQKVEREGGYNPIGPSYADLPSRPNVFRVIRLLLLGLVVGLLGSLNPLAAQTPSHDVAGNDKVARIFESFQARGAQRDDSQPTPANYAVKQFRLPSDLSIDLVASEPTISQPLFLSWDSRGRMWVVQYRQYQYPAGLKVTRFDQYLRAVYDKVPEPPPHGVPGEDRITVFEDTNGDGRYDHSKDVITGLNIATSVQVGRQGIWVLNPPYLLHYPDTNHDDIPDGDPEVHLSGFGLQDTHSVANSLKLSPDGWLYGANGSTTGGTISSTMTKGVRFEGQCIWRYHPLTKVFEIFAEGGGNTFSLEIDSKGRVFSGTNGGNKRGYYYPQGSYADKNWGKHGPLTNPYAFGYFSGMKHEGDTRRFAQAFAIYEGGLLPRAYAGTIIAPNSLHNVVWNSRRVADGSNYRTVDVANLLESDDRWFRPVDCKIGPDGGVYLADWYDTRLSHLSPVDDWHKESGRIYRLRPSIQQAKYAEGDLSTQSNAELIAKFNHSNKWVRHRAVLELGWRSNNDVANTLDEKVQQHASLEALWSLNLMNELTIARADRWIDHDDPHIRRWVIRLLGDRHQGIDAMVRRATIETNLQVRSQLASTAKRVDAETGLGIVSAMARSDSELSTADLADPHLPLLCWWAVEGHADDHSAIDRFLSSDELWSSRLAREVILSRLMRRFASRGGVSDLERCEQLVAMAPDLASQSILMEGLAQAFAGRAIPRLPIQLDAALSTYQQSLGNSGIVLELKSGREGAVAKAIKILSSGSTKPSLAVRIIQVLATTQSYDSVETLLNLSVGRLTNDPSVRRTAIAALADFDDDRVADRLISAFYGKISNQHQLRPTACRTLASRQRWALRLLDEINQWRLKPTDVPPDVVQQLRSYSDPAVRDATDQAFGKPITITSEQKITEINRLTKLIQSSGASTRN
ncbi:MAG: HEAT repeat domain-containing protein, partial [Planctomycetota bacterium]